MFTVFLQSLLDRQTKVLEYVSCKTVYTNPLTGCFVLEANLLLRPLCEANFFTPAQMLMKFYLYFSVISMSWKFVQVNRQNST